MDNLRYVLLSKYAIQQTHTKHYITTDQSKHEFHGRL